MTDRPQSLPCITSRYKIQEETDIGPKSSSLFVTVDFKDGKPYSIFIREGKAGTETTAMWDVMGKLISHLLEYGASVDDICRWLQRDSGALSFWVPCDGKGYCIKSRPPLLAHAIRELVAAYETKKEVPVETPGL